MVWLARRKGYRSCNLSRSTALGWKICFSFWKSFGFEELDINSDQWPVFDFSELNTENEDIVDLLLKVFPPEMFPDFKSWSAATRAHQAHLLKTQMKSSDAANTVLGGFTFDSFIDDHYKTTSGIIDQSGATKPAFDAVAQACAETIIIADPFFDLISKEKVVATNVTVVHDGRQPINDALITSHLTIEDETYTDKWRGDANSDTAQHIGRIEYPVLDHTKTVHLVLELESETQADNRYTYSRGE